MKVVKVKAKNLQKGDRVGIGGRDIVEGVFPMSFDPVTGNRIWGSRVQVRLRKEGSDVSLIADWGANTTIGVKRP